MTRYDALSDTRGQAFWQGLDQLLEQPDFRDKVDRHFPVFAGFDLARRDILKCLGATLALAGLDGCERQADETAMPFVRNPAGGPGAERHYASAVELDGVGQPIIGICRDGRPVKLEGNPAHPASGGATDAFTQAALLGLYDPARSQAPRREGAPATWSEAEAMLSELAARLDQGRGMGFHLLTGPLGSPSLLRQIGELRSRWPAMRWHVHAPLAGTVPEAVLPLEKVQALVALDADPLGPGPFQTIHARGWSTRRRAYQAGDGDALLFVAEPAPTLTGVASSERLIVRPRRIEALLAALSAALNGRAAAAGLTGKEQAWVGRAAQELLRHRGAAAVVLGAHHAAALHATVEAINAGLDAPQASHAPANPQGEDLAALVAAMKAGTAKSVMVLESNPAYSAPPDLAFAGAFQRVPLRIHAGLHPDETAELVHWHLPLAHLLESWSDVTAADGSCVIVQPLVRPFFDVRSRHQVLALFGGAVADGRALVQETWDAHDGVDRWNSWLLSGRVEPAAKRSAAPVVPATAVLPVLSGPGGLDLIIRRDWSAHDGQFAHNPWLQELPRPLTKITWDNAIEVGPALAARLELENEDLAELSVGDAKVLGPVWILPGIAPDTVLVHLGYGRRAGGQVGEGVGFDAYRLRTSGASWHRPGARLRKANGHHPLASTQRHTTMAGHDFVRYVEQAGAALPPAPEKPSMYSPQPKGEGPAWGMAIDLDLCIGCNACVTACVAENNIAMVGREQVQIGREMHWLRVDRYYSGAPEDPEHVFQPVPCMHCEDAPCEMGCPVNATVHSPDGLNLQVYNRCIGTRTCQAYCPYKVRRFNWLDYVREDPPELRAARNPEVTVRDRGVMEKCTYCIQRVERAKIEADADGRPMGEVRTACQQACPTQAIVFGNLADSSSEVSRRKRDQRDFALLEEANTRPRTTYGARIRKGRKS